MPSSSQPTGWPGRRAATTAPTVAELTTARTGMATSGKTNWARSARSARRNSSSSQGTAARQSSRFASHSAHASPAAHRRGRPGPAVEVIAVVLAARSAPPIRPPPTLVSCQCGRLASGQRYEGRTGPRYQPLRNRLLPGKGELVVQLPDRSRLAPGLQLQTEAAYVLEVRCDLLAGGQVQGLAPETTGLVDVALPDMGSCQGGHQSRPGLDDLGIQRRKG